MFPIGFAELPFLLFALIGFCIWTTCRTCCFISEEMVREEFGYPPLSGMIPSSTRRRYRRNIKPEIAN